MALIERAAWCYCAPKFEARGWAPAWWGLGEAKLEIDLPVGMQQTNVEHRTPLLQCFISSCVIWLSKHPVDDVRHYWWAGKFKEESDPAWRGARDCRPMLSLWKEPWEEESGWRSGREALVELGKARGYREAWTETRVNATYQVCLAWRKGRWSPKPERYQIFIRVCAWSKGQPI